jgi:cytochrome bd-type quinol oxidase subunit 2
MNRELSHWLLAGSILASGLIGIALGVAALSGFPNSKGGDSPASLGTGLAPAMLLVGVMTLLGLEVAHVIRRRPAHVIAAQPVGPQPAGAAQKTRVAR